jgi:UDP-GlcNAc:undecaprenyl-phosphate GlcNAc-1-phosphate transferase
MNNFNELAWAAGKAFLIALVLTPIIRDISRSYNVVDRPGFRKVHAHPIPRVGGIAIAAAYALSLISFTAAFPLMAQHSVAAKIIPGAALIFVTGLTDDLFNLRPALKLAGQLGAAGLVFWSGLRIEAIAQFTLPLWASFVLTVFWMLVCSNALNLIDGLDGLCAGMGLLATLTLFVAAMLHKNLPLAFATLPLAGALLGFLCYNFHPATVFLGDSGALLIGFLLGCYGMIWTQKAGTLLSVIVPILALSIPLFDVSLSVLRRFLRNRPIFSADRGHIHHRLLDRGLSPRQAVLVLYLVTALAAAFALLLSADLGRYQGFVILGFVAAAWLGIRQLRYSEFNLAGRWLFGGGLQRSVQGRPRFDALSAALNRTVTQEDWWHTLSKAAADFGWTGITWVSSEGRREEHLLGGSGAGTAAIGDDGGWTFTVALEGGESIEVAGLVRLGAAPVDLTAFAACVRPIFAAKRAGWERSRDRSRPALS